MHKTHCGFSFRNEKPNRRLLLTIGPFFFTAGASQDPDIVILMTLARLAAIKN